MKNISVEEHKYFNNKWFARWAKVYYYEKYLMFPIRKKAAQFLNLNSPKKIIDIACGTGSQAYELAKLRHDVIGIDLSPEMLAHAKRKLGKKLRLKFQQADATNLPFPDNTFDVASISFGLHDMPYEIDLLVLKEAMRVVKSKGTILIVEYMEPKRSLPARICYPVFRLYETKYWRVFVKRGLKDILKKVGVSKTKEVDLLGLVQIVKFINSK